MSTGECEFIRLFDGEPFKGKRLHCTAIWIDSKIYFIPGSANKIAVFCPENNSMEFIEISLPKPKQYKFYRSQFKFIKAIRNEDALWLVPCSYPGIIKLNIQSHTIQVFDEWLEDDDYFFRIGMDVTDGKIILANGKSNAVLIFDMEKETGKIEHIGVRNNGIMSICKVGENYWLAPRLQGAIIEWNPTKNIVTEYDEFPSEFEAGSIVFSNVYSISDKIFFIPSRSNNVLIYDNHTLRVINFNGVKEYEQSTVEYFLKQKMRNILEKPDSKITTDSSK